MAATTAYKRPVRVMIVDDSAVIRGMMTRALTQNPDIEIAASVVHGKAALNTIQTQPVDIILLDVEMPEMDGITALPLLLEKSPNSQVIMVSNLTKKDANFTMKALQLGASDCIAKPTSRGDKDEADAFFKDVEKKVLTLAREGRPSAEVAAHTAQPVIQEVPKVMSSGGLIKCLAIGSSTGGPQALMQIFRTLKGTTIRVPIFITQHMPKTFTNILASHIKSASDLPCEEGVDGKEALPGHIYIAPGDYHMVPYRKDNKVYIGLNQEPPVNFCRPAVDPMFEALAQVYGRNMLAVILTGMGQDGLKGCQAVKAVHGPILAQDEATSIVWGMPKAVAEAGLAKAIVPLDQMAEAIRKELL